MAQDSRIDAFIAAAAPFSQPILLHLRTLVHAAVPDLDEAVKWGMPHFVYKGKNLAGMAAFKAHCAFMIHGEGRQGDAMGQFGKIASLGDLPPDAELAAKLREACARIDADGTAVKPRPSSPRPSLQGPARVELAMPDDFAAALAQHPAASATLNGFAPSHRREYLEWIVEAKRPETRARRIAQAVEWLDEGKKRNWKYQGC